MNILVVGSGMYVTGGSSDDVGVILSSLAQLSKFENIEKITVVSRKKSAEAVVKEAQKRINGLLQTNITVNFIPLGTQEPLQIFTDTISKEKFDACIIATPDHTHFEYAQVAINSKIPCLVVKPFTQTYDEARQLVALQQKNGVYGMVEFHKRLDESNQYIRKQIQDRVYGDLLYAVVTYSQQISIPTEHFISWVDKTNIFKYLGVHYVDLFHFMTGFKPHRLSAIGIKGTLAERGIDVFDSMHVQLLWKDLSGTQNDFLVQYNTNWIDPVSTSAMSDQKYQVHGTKGMIDCNQKNRGLEEVIEAGGQTSVNPYFAKYLLTQDGMEFQGYGFRSIQTFISDVTNLQAGRISLEDLEHIRPTFKNALVSMAVLDAVEKSIENDSAWIDVTL
jgi:D-galacturonate reductase